MFHKVNGNRNPLQYSEVFKLCFIRSTVMRNALQYSQYLINRILALFTLKYSIIICVATH